jgi:hypothetical protein
MNNKKVWEWNWEENDEIDRKKTFWSHFMSNPSLKLNHIKVFQHDPINLFDSKVITKKI